MNFYSICLKMLVCISVLFIIPLNLWAIEVTYTYDNLNRLTSATHDNNGELSTLTYQYDALGNITSLSVTGCSFEISPESKNFPTSGGTQSVNILASQQNCTWNVSENISWVEVSPVNGIGDGTVTVSVDANSAEARSGVVTIAQNTFEITQDPVAADVILFDDFEGSSHGTISGATYTDNGYEGQGLLFDSVGDSVAYDASYFPLEGTFEAYVYLNGNNPNWNDIIFDSNARANYDNQNHIALYLRDDNTLQFKLWGIIGGETVVYTINSNKSLNLNKWYSVGASWGSEGMHLYINGKLEASNTAVTVAWDGGEPVYLGDCPDDDWAGSAYYNSLFGIIDSVRTSNKQKDITYKLSPEAMPWLLLLLSD